MGEWHRNEPELMGTDADPWMQHEDYRRALGVVPDRIAADQDRENDEWADMVRADEGTEN